MKQFLKITIIAVLIPIIYSCSTAMNEENIQETTDVVMTVQSSKQNKVQQRKSSDVNRGNIYPWVSHIKATFDNKDLNLKKDFNYNLVNSNGADNFIADGIFIGNNIITSETRTNVAPIEAVKYESTGSNNAKNVIDNLRKQYPYVIYKSDPITKNITNQGPNVINLKLNTIYGRRISAIRWSKNSTLSNSLKARVTVIKYNGDILQSNVLSKNGAVYHYWSNRTSIDGSKAKFKVELFNSSGSIIKTFYKNIEIEASKSIGCIFEITDNDLVQSSQLTFDFQEWLEVWCDDCPE